MRLVSYIITTPMDSPVLRDAIDSLSYFSDHIYIIDGMQGRGTLCHYPLSLIPIRDWLLNCPEFIGGKWNKVSVTLLENEFIHPAAQRSWALSAIGDLDGDSDWIVWIDSDEVCSWEMIHGIRDFLDKVPDSVSDVCQKWLNLVQDEQHCVGGHHSSWLSHSKIHRAGSVRWANEWHEHGVFAGQRIKWDTRVIHTRALYRRILLVQRGHPVIGRRISSVLPEAPMFWDDAVMEHIPSGITWLTLHIPEGEIIPFPFEGDAAKVWDYRTGEQIGRVEDA